MAARHRERADVITIYCMGAGLAVLALVAVVLLAMELVSRSLPHWIDSSASKARNLFEVLYFIAGVTLPVIAVVALLVARNQVAFAREQNASPNDPRSAPPISICSKRSSIRFARSSR